MGFRLNKVGMDAVDVKRWFELYNFTSLEYVTVQLIFVATLMV